MSDPYNLFTRRNFLGTVALGSLAVGATGAFADELAPTPLQTEGPFYPDKLPLDTDNDLIVVNDALTPAVGEITHLTGRILDSHGDPIRGALVEIWQCDANGAYLHSRTTNRDKRDGNFQGFGRFLTGSRGQYYFRTIKPVPYPGRTPHIHFMVKRPGHEKFTTQCYIKGYPQNQRDFIFRAVGDPKQQDLLCADFAPIKESKAGELAAAFDIVLGYTPEQG
jgi:protocatechuate 3,4-dioxygenase, beta subunit